MKNQQVTHIKRHWVLVVVGILFLILGSHDSAMAQPTFYWTNGSAIQRMNPSTGVIESVFALPFVRLSGLAIDQEGEQMYWGAFSGSGPSNPYRYFIMRSNLDGTGLDTVAISPDIIDLYINKIALDLQSGKIFWNTSDWDTRNGIFTINLDGTQFNRVPVCDGHAFGLNTITKRIYYACGPWMLSSNYDGTQVDTLLQNPNQLGVLDIEFDQIHDRLYWSIREINNGVQIRGRFIMRCNPDGSSLDSLVTGQNMVELALDPEQDKLYFAGNHGEIKSAIFSSTLDGSDIEPVVLNVGNQINGLAIYSGSSSVPVHPEASVPDDFELQPVYPNPFNSTTNLAYTLGKPDRIRITVHDLLGHIVAVLLDDVQPAGTYRIAWTVEPNLPNGVYFYTLETKSGKQTKTMIRIR